MHFAQSLISLLLFWNVAVSASPFNRFPKRQQTGTSNLPTSGSSSSSSSSSSSTSSSSSEIIVIGGEMPSNGSAQMLFNTTGTLNLTQLYAVGEAVNKSLQSSSSGAVVIQADKKSFESLSFFLSIIIDDSKTVIITNDADIGSIVAMDSNIQGRGVLYVGKSWVIYSGALPPFGVPVGVIGDNDEVYWVYDSAVQTGMFASNSTLKTTYSNFSNPTLNDQVAVPIVYQEGITSSLSSALGSSNAIGGMVIVSDGSMNGVSQGSSGSSSGGSSSGGATGGASSGSSSNSTGGASSGSNSSSNSTSGGMTGGTNSSSNSTGGMSGGSFSNSSSTSGAGSSSNSSSSSSSSSGGTALGGSSGGSSGGSVPVFPVIFTNPSGKKITWLSEKNIPSYAIAGGWLSPVQAQILLGVAVNNGVTSPESIKALFP